MPRVKLSELDSYEFSFDLQVRITDINIANHLGHVELIGLLHEARHQFFKKLGFSELNLGKENTGIVIIDLVINYKQEVFAGEKLSIEVQLNDIQDKSFRLYYRVKRDDVLIGLAETGIAPFVYGEKKPVAVPAEFIDSLNSYRGKTIISAVSE